jgi:hypothetical protein
MRHMTPPASRRAWGPPAPLPGPLSAISEPPGGLSRHRRVPSGFLEMVRTTGGALDSDEGTPGPIVLQGTEGEVWFRDLVVAPAR